MDEQTTTETTETTQDHTDWRSEDGIWLDHLAERLAVGDQGVVFDDETIKRLRGIAIGCDQLALEKRRLVALEERVDQMLCETIELWLECDEPQEDNAAMLMAAIWLLARRTQSVGTKSLIGGGLGSIGAAAIASMFSSGSKKP